MEKTSRPFVTQVGEILRNFDFERVQKTMTALDWTWAINGEWRVPTLNDIVSSSARQLIDLYNSPPDTISSMSGGIRASRTRYGTYSLEFVVTQGRDYDAEAEEEMTAIQEIETSRT